MLLFVSPLYIIIYYGVHKIRWCCASYSDVLTCKDSSWMSSTKPDLLRAQHYGLDGVSKGSSALITLPLCIPLLKKKKWKGKKKNLSYVFFHIVLLGFFFSKIWCLVVFLAADLVDLHGNMFLTEKHFCKCVAVAVYVVSAKCCKCKDKIKGVFLILSDSLIWNRNPHYSIYR